MRWSGVSGNDGLVKGGEDIKGLIFGQLINYMQLFSSKGRSYDYLQFFEKRHVLKREGKGSGGERRWNNIKSCVSLDQWVSKHGPKLLMLQTVVVNI